MISKVRLGTLPFLVSFIFIILTEGDFRLVRFLILGWISLYAKNALKREREGEREREREREKKEREKGEREREKERERKRERERVR